MNRSLFVPSRVPWRDRILAVGGWTLDFLLPAVCPSCGVRLREEEYGLCGCCMDRLESPIEPVCGYCGRSRGGSGPERRCDQCKILPKDGFDAARAAYLYHGPIVDIIHHLKYHKHEELSESLGRWLFLFWRDRWREAEEVDLITPVPLHIRRLWKRGYNQSESLAEVLSRLSGTPIVSQGLVRSRPTATQTRLSPKERWKNVEGAFEVVYPVAFRNKTILLIDDVMTTGATFCAAAQSLKEAGAKRVLALALTSAGA